MLPRTIRAYSSSYSMERAIYAYMSWHFLHSWRIYSCWIYQIRCTFHCRTRSHISAPQFCSTPSPAPITRYARRLHRINQDHLNSAIINCTQNYFSYYFSPNHIFMPHRPICSNVVTHGVNMNSLAPWLFTDSSDLSEPPMKLRVDNLSKDLNSL